jgi:hypothetical protein
MVSAVDHVVGNEKGVPVEKYAPMKIIQDEKPAKVEPRAPERVWDPGIQIVIRIRRRVVGNYGGAFTVIVIVDNLRARIRGVVIHWCIHASRGWPAVGLG